MKKILLVILLFGFIAGYMGIAAADNLNVSIQAPVSVSANTDVEFNIDLDSQDETRGFSLLVNIPQTWTISGWSVIGLDNPGNVSYQQAPDNLCYEDHIAYVWIFENSPAYHEKNPIKENMNAALNLVLKASGQGANYQIICDWFTTEPNEFGNYPIDIKLNGSRSEPIDNISEEVGLSGSGGGGGGGGGGSPEPVSNVEVKELSQQFVSNGKFIKFSFPRDVTCISYLGFDAKKSFGKVTTIVEMLKGKSFLVEGLPEGYVYKNVNTWVGSGGISNSIYIENAVVCFKVEKDWLEEMGADPTSVNLWHYNKKMWNKLETSKISEDEKYFYFESKTPGFSSFAIVASVGDNSSISVKSPISETSTPYELSDQMKDDMGNKAGSEDNNSSFPIPEISSLFTICIICAACGFKRK